MLGLSWRLSCLPAARASALAAARRACRAPGAACRTSKHWEHFNSDTVRRPSPSSTALAIPLPLPIPLPPPAGQLPARSWHPYTSYFALPVRGSRASLLASHCCAHRRDVSPTTYLESDAIVVVVEVLRPRS